MARNYVALPFGGVLALCAILLLAPEVRGQSFTVKPKKYVISGTVGLAGVTMQGFSVSPAPTTDQNGVYSVEVSYGWSGTVTPMMNGYTFTPRTRSYPRVTADLADENYTPTLQTYTISGLVGLPDVSLIGFPEDVVSDASGRYTTTVPWHWSGTVKPMKTAHQFDPPEKSYNEVARNITDDYKASDQMIAISGTAGVEGVLLKGLPGSPVLSGAQGVYRAVVKYGWSGTIIPTKEGHEFSPPQMSYEALTENQTNQDYTARVFTYEISGTAGMAGVLLKGLPVDVMTDLDGYYSVTVNHGWSGKIVPEKPGFTFTPSSLDVPKVTAAKENQNFSAKTIYLTISGNAGTSKVIMAGLPGDPESNDRGLYTAQVEWGWVGSVTPTKDGFAFNPPSKDFGGVTQNMTQNFAAQGITFKISGNVGGLAGVALRGLPAGTPPVVTGPDGSYSVDVPYGWKGKLIPQKAGYSFEPDVREYLEILYHQMSQDYVARMMQYSLAGRIMDDLGNGVADVQIFGDNNAGSTTTDFTGQFELKVDHGWRGRLTFAKDGYTFTPPTRPFELVANDVKNVAVAAKVRMLTIKDKIMAGVEPIAEVTITAIPGDFPGAQPVVTDLSGVYSIKVPWGWMGELKVEKEGFEFDPPTRPFATVTEDIDNVSPKKPPVAPTSAPQPPLQAQPQLPLQPQPQPAPGPAPMDSQRIVQLREERNALEMGPVLAVSQQRLFEINQELSRLLGSPTRGPGPEDTTPSPGLDTVGRGEMFPQPIVDRRATPAPPTPDGLDLRDFLTELGRRKGATITWDATIKAERVPIALSSVDELPVSLALQRVLSSVSSSSAHYGYDEIGEGRYKVYRALSNMFADDDLVQALQDLSVAAGVPIITDPNITGRVNISFDSVSLDTALEMLLAGKPYVFKKFPRYYLVADRGMMGLAFPDISETRRVRLNHTPAMRAVTLLSPVFRQYVQAELDNPRDPNDQGNTLVITAAPGMIERIVDDIKQIDHYKRQVLLDARVVAMERGDLLNLGVEWGWPRIQAGAFADRVPEIGTGSAVGGWPWGVKIGYSPDRAFTDSLMMVLNLLQENSQADIIANPKVVAQDGKQAQMQVIQEEWFMMTGPETRQAYSYSAQLQKIESGTVLTITPYVGDNNDITLQMAVEVSDSNPKGRGSDLPIVTRRMARNYVTVKNGGTVAVGGLTENRSKSSDKRVPGLSNLPLIGELFKNRNNDKASREVAVFVTAHLVPEGVQVASRPQEAHDVPMREATSDDEFARRLREALASQPQ